MMNIIQDKDMFIPAIIWRGKKTSAILRSIDIAINVLENRENISKEDILTILRLANRLNALAILNLGDLCEQDRD